ncbi:phosphatidate cytidylyltransferase [Bombiscardovia apis]|uniref:Phosphatidate cytidylyltransferase n=2 Tax=Bombiscardovia apis TaxID=2932182 RepID=A0ABN6SH93_9BIFI|nr:phosphatidate cytidylyltransferase [Bombiscardovia apis]BDR54631.1 phosphatidate cytidylyltransferase [Bombiscardovia apis]
MKQPQQDQTSPTLDTINTRTGRNMPQAIATGVLLVVVILGCLLVKPDAFMLLIVCFMSLGLWELRVDFATAGLDIPILALWVCSAGTILAMFYGRDHVLWMVAGVFLTAVIVTICASFQHRGSRRLERAVASKLNFADSLPNQSESGSITEGNPPVVRVNSRYANVSVSLLTVVYITFLANLIVLPTTFGGHPVAHGLISVFLPAVSDIGGLAFGAWLGKHKLSPRISPKKSVEGLLGSMGLCIIAAGAIFACTYPRQEWAQIWWVAVLLGAMVGITGTFGDLSASLIKRDLGIKDMGHLLKGHGGVLDRVDSILMSAPFIAGLLWVTGL